MRITLRLMTVVAMLMLTVTAASALEVGVVLAGSVLTFWQTLSKGIEQAATDLNVSVLIRSPVDDPLNQQANVQLKLIDYFVRDGAASIILAPEKLHDVPVPVSIAVPIVCVDRGSADYKALSTISTDNFTAGRTAAMALAPVLAKGATVAVFRHSSQIISTTDRENGFLSVAHEKGWNVVIDAYVGYRYRYRETQELIAKSLKDYAENEHAGRLDAIFAPSEPIAYGAIRIVEAMPPQDRPRLVVFDWRPEMTAELQNGVVYATIVQDAFRMGYRALGAAVAAARGQSVPPTQFIDVATVTRENLNDPAIQSVLDGYRK